MVEPPARVLMRLSDLLDLPVVEDSGRSRGRVYDVLASREGEAYGVAAIVVGEHGLLQRLGLRPSGRRGGKRDEIPWEKVLRIEAAKRIVVRP
jgi:sporulation protein YlmC with PRC-barrel domain